MKTTASTRRTVLAAAGLILTALAAANSYAQASAGQPIIIGVTFDAAKAASYYSQLQKDALEVLVKTTNAKGGVLGRQVQFAFEDDENNPSVASQKVEKLAGMGAVFIIEIGSSGTGLAAQKKAEELGIPNGSPMNVADKLTAAPVPPHYFRLALRDGTSNQAIIAYMKSKLASPKIAVVRDSTETGLLSSDSQITLFKEAGLNVVAVEQIPQGASDVTVQAVRVRNANPDFVFLAGGSIPELANYVKAHRRLKNNAAMIGGNILGVPSFPKLSGPAADGVIFADAVDMSRTDVQAVEKILIAEKGDRLADSIHAIFAWEYGNLILDTIRAAGSADRAKIRQALEATTNRPSLLGPIGTKISFGPGVHDGLGLPSQVVLRVIRDGKFSRTELAK